MLLEPPYTLNGSYFDHSLTPRWRHMKYAVPRSLSFLFYCFLTHHPTDMRVVCSEIHMYHYHTHFYHKARIHPLPMASRALIPAGIFVPPMIMHESCVMLKIHSAPKPSQIPGMTSQEKAFPKICNGNLLSMYSEVV